MTGLFVLHRMIPSSPPNPQRHAGQLSSSKLQQILQTQQPHLVNKSKRCIYRLGYKLIPNIKFPMARQLHITQIPLNTSQAAMAGMTLLLCAFALFMCASHSRKWRRWSTCYGSSNQSPVIQLNTEAMMLSTGVRTLHGRCNSELLFSGEQQQQGVGIWQKNILMGGKCQLPDFSGVIIYDSDGNVVAPAKNPHPLLTWK